MMKRSIQNFLPVSASHPFSIKQCKRMSLSLSLSLSLYLSLTRSIHNFLSVNAAPLLFLSNNASACQEIDSSLLNIHTRQVQLMHDIIQN